MFLITVVKTHQEKHLTGRGVCWLTVCSSTVHLGGGGMAEFTVVKSILLQLLTSQLARNQKRGSACSHSQLASSCFFQSGTPAMACWQPIFRISLLYPVKSVWKYIQGESPRNAIRLTIEIKHHWSLAQLTLWPCCLFNLTEGAETRSRLAITIRELKFGSYKRNPAFGSVSEHPLYLLKKNMHSNDLHLIVWITVPNSPDRSSLVCRPHTMTHDQQNTPAPVSEPCSHGFLSSSANDCLTSFARDKMCPWDHSQSNPDDNFCGDDMDWVQTLGTDVKKPLWTRHPWQTIFLVISENLIIVKLLLTITDRKIRRTSPCLYSITERQSSGMHPYLYSTVIYDTANPIFSIVLWIWKSSLHFST